MQKEKPKGRLLHIIISAVAGVVFFFLGELLYPVFTQKMFTPLGIALYFLIFFVIIGIVVVVFSFFKADFSNEKNRENYISNIKLTCIVLVGFFILTGVFEFLYELGNRTIPDPTSYIFLVDDSGSMKGTEQQRNGAINAVIKDSDIPYAVYSFDTQAQRLRPMTNRSDIEETWSFESDGGTDILKSIQAVLTDLDTKQLIGAGSYPKILLLSDGSSSHKGLSQTAKQATDQDVSISTIGIGNCDQFFLKKIARNTGGVYVYCDDVAQLSQSLKNATASDFSRNLLSDRLMSRLDWLYTILRILFLTIIGFIWSAMKMLLSYDDKLNRKLFRLSFLLCTVGAVLMELLVSHLEVTDTIVRLIFCVLWAIIIGMYESYGFDSQSVDGESNNLINTSTPQTEYQDEYSVEKVYEEAEAQSVSISSNGSPFDSNTESPFSANNDDSWLESDDPFS